MSEVQETENHVVGKTLVEVELHQFVPTGSCITHAHHTHDKHNHLAEMVPGKYSHSFAVSTNQKAPSALSTVHAHSFGLRLPFCAISNLNISNLAIF